MLKNLDFLAFKLSDVVFIMLVNVKVPTIVGTLTFMGMIKKFLVQLSWVWFFITSGPDLRLLKTHSQIVGFYISQHICCCFVSEKDSIPEYDVFSMLHFVHSRTKGYVSTFSIRKRWNYWGHHSQPKYTRTAFCNTQSPGKRRWFV